MVVPFVVLVLVPVLCAQPRESMEDEDAFDAIIPSAIEREFRWLSRWEQSSSLPSSLPTSLPAPAPAPVPGLRHMGWLPSTMDSISSLAALRLLLDVSLYSSKCLMALMINVCESIIVIDRKERDKVDNSECEISCWRLWKGCNEVGEIIKNNKANGHSACHMDYAISMNIFFILSFSSDCFKLS
jgi:hypothetical protein